MLRTTSLLIVLTIILNGFAWANEVKMTRRQATDQISAGTFPETIRLDDAHIEALMRFPDLSSCLASGGPFDGKEDFDWAAFENSEEILFCGYWLADYFRDLEKMHEWASIVDLKAEIRPEGNGDTYLFFNLLTVDKLKIFKGKFPFFWIRPRSAYLKIWVRSDGVAGILFDATTY